MPHSPDTRSIAGFTLVELLVSMAILSLVAVLMVAMVNQTTRTWTSTRAKIEQFREAQDGFEALTRQISQSTLNTYLDYQRAADGSVLTGPTNSYVRQSELRFICGPNLIGSTDQNPTVTHSIFFQAPLGVVSENDQSVYGGLQGLLNTWGYFINYSNDSNLRPAFISAPTTNRFRLMELMQPSEAMTLYKYTNGTPSYAGHEWYTDALTAQTPPVHVLANNIIALVLLPKLSPQDDPMGLALAPYYSYDSTASNANPAINPKNQLPPVIQVTMFAIDETSANRLSASDNQQILTTLSPLFTNAANFTADSNTLTTFLDRMRISYRVFTTSVSLKAAKWSRDQIN